MALTLLFVLPREREKGRKGEGGCRTMMMMEEKKCEEAGGGEEVGRDRGRAALVSVARFWCGEAMALTTKRCPFSVYV